MQNTLKRKLSSVQIFEEDCWMQNSWNAKRFRVGLSRLHSRILDHYNERQSTSNPKNQFISSYL